MNRIRDCLVADLPVLAGFLSSEPDFSWPIEEISAILGRQTHSVRVVIVEAQAAGFYLSSYVADECNLLYIYIAPAFRQRGLANQLLADLRQQCLTRAASRIYLEVRSSNRAALCVYRRFGFQQTGLRKAYYRSAYGREDALLFTYDC